MIRIKYSFHSGAISVISVTVLHDDIYSLNSLQKFTSMHDIPRSVAVPNEVLHHRLLLIFGEVPKEALGIGPRLDVNPFCFDRKRKRSVTLNPQIPTQSHCL